MKSKLQKRITILICIVFLFACSYGQLVNAQNIEIYKGADVQKFTAAELEGTKPDINNPKIQTIDAINGTVKFTSKIPSGSKYDILRSDNGGEYDRLTDFQLSSVDFEDKYVLSGHTYYYIVVVYDANGAVLSNNGPYKTVAAHSSITIILQLDNPKASVNGVNYTLDVKPFIEDGRTMVPLRFVSEALGAQVGWSGEDKKITVSLDGNIIILWIGKSEAKVNNETVFMDVPAMVINGRTLVPIRFVSEKLKMKVDFENETKKITISGGQSDKQQQVATPTPQPTNTNESTLKSIIKSGKTYSGVSTQGSISAKYSITFNNYNEQTGQYKGKIEWIGYSVFDDIVGKLDGDKLIFKQTARYQNNKAAPMDCTVTMKIESSNRVSGTWIDSLAGSTGTTWFEFTPFTATPVTISKAKYNGSFDSRGFPTGKATVEFGNNITFTGDVEVKENNLIAIGAVTYPDGTKAIGRFVNGKPDGLNSIIYPDSEGYLIDFLYGQPIDFYVANTIPVYQADQIEVYKANDIAVFKADDIEEFHADDIEEFYADNIEPYKAEIIEMFQAQPVEKNSSIVTIDKFQAEVVKLNPPGSSSSSIPVGGFTSPDYMNPLVQAWTAHMTALPYLINNNMGYSY